MQNPAVSEKFAKLGADAMMLSTGAFAKLVRDEVAINTKIAAAAGAKAN